MPKSDFVFCRIFAGVIYIYKKNQLPGFTDSDESKIEPWQHIFFTLLTLYT
jgi:hypothetical protein